MSVINQVLSQLEERGAPTAPEQTMVRAVPRGKRSLMLPLLAVALAFAGGIGAWQWIQLRKPKIAAVGAVPPQVVVAPVSVVPAPAVIAASMVGAIAKSETPPAEITPPASRLSFELGSVPLPSSLRKPGSVIEPAGVETPAAPVPAPAAAPRSMQAPLPNTPPAARAPATAPPMKQVSAEQRIDAEFRKAVASMQQGHIADAIVGYEAVLRMDAGHDAARQALVALLLESRRGVDAERVLLEGLKVKSDDAGLAMLLARLQVERGAVEQALATLEKSLPYADMQADYQAFFAALLQRRNRHKEAITHYQIALQLAPGNGVWLMGYGISLQAAQRTDDARDAFRRALESGTLNPELQAFVQQKLKEL